MNPKRDSPFLGKGESVLVGCEPVAPTSLISEEPGAPPGPPWALSPGL